MRFKYYLRGCGLGIILAVIVLAVGYYKESKDSTVSDAEIIQRAQELGMVMPEGGDDEPGVGTEAAEPDTETLAEPLDSQADIEPEGGEQPDTEPSDKTDTEEPDQPESESKDRDDKDSESTADEEKTVKVRIRRGEVCREIAEDLYEKGLVADAEEFRLFMRDNGYDNLIQTGTYTLTVGMDYEEIAEMITKKE